MGTNLCNVVHYLHLYSSFVLEVQTFNYYNLTDVFNYFYVSPCLKSLNTILVLISIPIMLGVKLDVNWCSDIPSEILVN